ncbi:hypothetical protein AGMMS49546_10750 [Spirochaetia bacterium]|nr:hypothetical protein AGMMS49546_10750 [Spirochaetia bacterium]
MQFKAFEDNIEVNGRTVYAFVDGMGDFKSLGEKYMSDAGIGKMKNDKWIFDPEGWYPQQAWLDGFAAVSREVGDGILYKIGCAIPDNAFFPPWVTDIHSAIRSIDIAYHSNHRKNGKVLFDEKSGTVYEGIGHYGYEQVQGKNLILSVSNNPYPCMFDKGIITAMAQKYDLKAIVFHDDSKPCRKNGAETCTYLVSW